MNKPFQIAIDGPVAAGKGTVSRKVADKLGFLYVDTGATYRVATLIALRNELDFEKLDGFDEVEVSQLISLLANSEIGMARPEGETNDGRLISLFIDGEDVSWRIREQDVSTRVFIVAKIPEVRDVLVKKQQEIASEQDVVMEGRDITYRVLPDAQLKIYLDANMEERAKRRQQQLVEKGDEVSIDELRKQIEERDRVDSERATDPLKVVDDAWHLDTTGIEIDKVVEMVVGRVGEIRN